MGKNSLATKVFFVQDWVSLGYTKYKIKFSFRSEERTKIQVFLSVYTEYFNSMLGSPWIEVGQDFLLILLF